MNKSEEVKIQGGAAGEVSRWCVVQTNTHQERLARFHLERGGIGAYLPMRAVDKKRASVETAAPFLPSYLFAAVDPKGECWARIFSTIGVRGVVSSGGQPRIAPVGLVERIRSWEVNGLVLAPTTAGDEMSHAPGDEVRILRGAFAGYDAIIHEANDAKRVMVLLSLFGARRPVQVNARDLRSLNRRRA